MSRTACSYRPSDIHQAAYRSLLWLQERNGGRLPDTFPQAWKLVIRCGLSCRHLREASARDGELIEQEAGEWTVFYHPRLSERRRIRVILHELIEWLCVTEDPQLMLDLPGGGVYHYDGGDNPRDVRHRTARAGERLYQRMVKEQGRGDTCPPAHNISREIPFPSSP